MEIIKLEKYKIQKASLMVAEAFFEYPMFRFYFPDPGNRARNLSWYFKNILNCALQYGEIFTNENLSGVLFILPPGHTQISLMEYIQNGFFLTPFKLGFKNYLRSMKCEDYVGQTHQNIMQGRQHYYLWGLAVDPKCQQKGIGSSLLKPVIQKADSENKPIYLETHDKRNVTYYQRKGFSLVRSDMIPSYDLPFWCMLREPD
ncbi:MAG: GNAT family N-acetyltransferase [Anaerolineaceae bacterium]|nr:GNAT family N-acetyltransferase [Anaerolineaceae bacterium]